MAVILRPEDGHRRLDLREGADQVGLDGLDVGVGATGAQRGALAEAGVDDDAVESTQSVREVVEHDGTRSVVDDVEIGDLDGPGRPGQLRGEGSRRSRRRAASASERPRCANARAMPSPSPELAP